MKKEQLSSGDDTKSEREKKEGVEEKTEEERVGRGRDK